MPGDNHLGKDGPLLAQRRSHAAKSQLASRGAENEYGVFNLRWTSARLVHKIRHFLSHSTVGPIPSINDPNLNHPSSLALFPAAMACPSPSITTITTLFRQTLPLLPRAAHSFYHTHINPHLSSTPSPTTPTPTLHSRYPNATSAHPVVTPHNHHTTPPHYHYLHAALHFPTCRAAFTHLLIAATLNHIRRTLAPQLGSFLWHVNPLDGLRLAVSNPEVFVAEMLGGVMPTMPSGSGGGVGSGGFMMVGGVGRSIVGAVMAVGRVMGESLLRGALDLAGGWAGAVLVGGYGWRGVDGMVGSEERVVEGERGREIRGAERERRREGWLRLAAVGYLFWVLVTVEYVFARSMNTAAWLVACYRLLVGGRVGRDALMRTLGSNWAQMPLVTWQLGYYLRNGVGPLLWRSLWCAVQGRPALLLATMSVAGGIRMLLKYRSTFYIALEVSGVFVFVGYLLVALVLLGLGLFEVADLSSTVPAETQEETTGCVLDEADLGVMPMANKTPSNITSMASGRSERSRRRVFRKTLGVKESG